MPTSNPASQEWLNSRSMTKHEESLRTGSRAIAQIEVCITITLRQ